MVKAATEAAARLFLAFAALLWLFPLLFADNASAAQQPIKIAATSHILREIAAFICGGRAEVRALSMLDLRGTQRIVARPKNDEIILAFDAADATRHRINEKNVNLQLLFDKVQVSEADMRAAFFDPARLPFVAQEVMKTISNIDPEGYPYYQRRLAEFQSRLDSAIGVGRYLLGESGTKILDFTGAEGVWIRSSIPNVVRPPSDVWDRWLSGSDESLKAAIDEAARRSWLILLDPWTPEPIRNAATRYANTLTLPAPSGNGDIFVFFHNMLAAISAKLDGK